MCFRSIETLRGIWGFKIGKIEFWMKIAWKCSHFSNIRCSVHLVCKTHMTTLQAEARQNFLVGQTTSPKLSKLLVVYNAKHIRAPKQSDKSSGPHVAKSATHGQFSLRKVYRKGKQFYCPKMDFFDFAIVTFFLQMRSIKLILCQ